MIDPRDFRRLDLNLLVVLAALMQERSATGAARRLYVGQSAVSMALRRLREQWGDPLFVRGRSGLEPTPAAVELWSRVAPALAAVHGAHARQAQFEPGRVHRTVRLGMPDDFEAYLLPRLLARARPVAPGLRLAFRATDRHSVTEMLERGEIDLAIGVAADRPAWIVAERLLRTRLLCVYDAQRLRVRRALTLSRFLALPHLLVTFDGELHGRVDDALAERGLSRRVVAGGSHFLAVGAALRETDAVACMPEPVTRLLAERFGLATCVPPLAIPEFEMTLLRHRRAAQDALLDWLADLVRAAYAEFDRPLRSAAPVAAAGTPRTSAGAPAEHPARIRGSRRPRAPSSRGNRGSSPAG